MALLNSTPGAKSAVVACRVETASSEQTFAIAAEKVLDLTMIIDD